MNRSMQILIATTCVIVIACGGIYLMDRKEIADQKAADREWAAMIERSERKAFADAQRAKSQAKIDDCAADLDAYDNQNSANAFVHRAKASGKELTGDALLSEVAACREMVNSSKPSEQPE